MKDTKSLLLALLSVGLVGTWVYHLYDKSVYSRRIAEAYVKDSVAVADAIRDSLQKKYTAAIQNLDTKLDSTKTDADSLKNQLTDKKEQLDQKIAEINKLKYDIGGILNNRNASKADLNLAQQKITELEQKVEELRNDKTAMEEEKKRLSALLEQATNDMKNLEQSVRKLDAENRALAEKVTLASTFTASELQLSAVSTNGSKEQETSQVKKTDKFVLSFVVQNNIAESNTAEVYIVIQQPNGQVVLQSEVWDSGLFDTRNEGKKSYTLRMRFEYNKGEAKHLVFTLNAESYQKGNYTMQVYHNGILIGQTVKKLN
jgi:myosin heavy subunit